MATLSGNILIMDYPPETSWPTYLTFLCIVFLLSLFSKYVVIFVLILFPQTLLMRNLLKIL